jgi:hypothetical protein
MRTGHVQLCERGQPGDGQGHVTEQVGSVARIELPAAVAVRAKTSQWRYVRSDGHTRVRGGSGECKLTDESFWRYNATVVTQEGS